MEPYLRGRSQKVYFGRDSSSDPVSLSYALPQGSGLGPIKFAIYVIPLGVIIRRYEIDYHMYADDNRIYLAFDLGDKKISAAIAKMESCVAEIRVWMRNNMLKLNDDKTEVVMFSSPHHKACLKDQILNIGSVQISPAPGARNLFVQMDQLLNMSDQVNSICRSSYIQLCYLRSIQKKMTPESLVKVVHAFITSRLDYCNSLLMGLPACQIAKLQRIQNIAARIVTKNSGRYEHATPLLKSLHWLPVRYRIGLKVLMLAYRCLTGTAPLYLVKLLSVRNTGSMRLRSSNAITLDQPTACLKTYGDRAFGVAAPRLWNALPWKIRNASSIAIFKKSLKTHLFYLTLEC